MKKRTINQRLLAYCLILFFLSSAIAVYVNVGAEKALKIYNNFTNQYSELNAFYKHVADLDGYAQMYLYSSDQADLARYADTLHKCFGGISELKKTAFSDNLIMEYTRLQNMVETYAEVFQEIGIDNENFQEKYGFYSRIAENIENTYVEYSSLVSEEMNAAKERMDMQLKKQIATTILFVSGMMASAILFAYSASRDITRPIQKIVSGIERIKRGNYDLCLPEQVSTVELAILKEAVQGMAVEVQNSIRHVQEKSQLETQLLEIENENLKVKEVLIETELKVLQGQMNPHFLFNTLSLISKMAYLEGADKTSGLMETTSDLLRYSLDKSNRVSDLYSELESVKNYIAIQEIRFGHRIQFDLKTEVEIPNVIMPGMIIQPLIENAVIHGVKDMIRGAYVLISVKRSRDKVVILVEDNGSGMDSSRLEAVQSGVEEKSIGINNVRKRLELFFGIKPIMSIESAVQCGTAITVELPITDEGEENDE